MTDGQETGEARMWVVWDPTRRTSMVRGPQRMRPREHARAVVVDSWPASDPPPHGWHGSDAQAWDAWRARRGVA